MAHSARWYTIRRWAGLACWLVCGVTAAAAQEGRWERVTAVGVQALEQGDYAAARQFQAALPLADAGSLVSSLMNLAAVYYAQGQYTDAARLYQRALVLQEQVLGPDDPQLVPVLEANAAVHRKMQIGGPCLVSCRHGLCAADLIHGTEFVYSEREKSSAY